MTAIDTQLFATAGDHFGALKQQLWMALDAEIDLKDCHIYRSVARMHAQCIRPTETPTGTQTPTDTHTHTHTHTHFKTNRKDGLNFA